MSLAASIGLVAGLLQALAHFLYTVKALRGETRPNGATWLLWTAGSLAFCLVTSRLGVPASLLAAPAVCALGSIGLASLALARDPWLRPARQDRAALAIGAAILALYVTVALAASDARVVALAGLAAVVACCPILRTTFLDPRNERPLAWLVWSASYGLMTLAAMLEGIGWPFLVYPVAAHALNLLIGLLALEPDDSFARSAGRAEALDGSVTRSR